MPTELRASKALLDQRWGQISNALSAALGLNVQELRLEAEYQAEGVWVGLQGAACERVVRNRGGSVSVVPLHALPLELTAWLGLQEVWGIEPGQPQFVFRQLGLTVHFGFQSDPIKPQVLRLEWPGARDWTGAGVTYQAPGAGHPHWQMDIIQSLATEGDSAAVNFSSEEVVEDFAVEVAAIPLGDLVRSLTVENMHLASAAPWWLSPPADGRLLHTSAPTSLPDLSRWLLHSVSYLRQELARCGVRG